jgi:excisionase family DNA binding protein
MRNLVAPDVADDLAAGLRLRAGQLRARGQTLSAGAQDLLTDLERSRPRSSERALDRLDIEAEGGVMPPRNLDYAGASFYTALPESTLRKYVRSGELRRTMFGRSVRFTIEDLDDFIDRHREQVAA